MNILLGCLLLILSTYVGTCFSKKYTERNIFYNDFIVFNNNLKNEINYSQNTIFYILNNKTRKNSDFYNCVKAFFFDKQTFVFEKNYINNEEKTFFNNYLQTIGSGDKVAQLKYVELISQQLKEKVKKTEEDQLKYKSTYIKLGFLVGLILLIVLL